MQNLCFDPECSIFGICLSLVWPVVVTGRTGQSAGPADMLSTGLTGGV
jgi:hypothetical protein